MRAPARDLPATRACADALSALRRAIGFHRLYPATHPHCAGAVEATLAAVRIYHDRFGSLEVAVRRDGVYHEDAPLLGAEETLDLASLLYPEGLRSLAIDPGLDALEVGSLVEVLAGVVDGEGARRDLVDELWERALPHLRFSTYDAFSPAAVASRRQDPLLAPVADRIRELFGESAGYADDGDELASYLERSVPSVDPSPAVPEHAARFLAHPDGAARQAFAARLHDPFLGDDLGRAADIVAWATQEEDDAPEGADVARFLGAAALGAVWRGRLGQASELVARAQGSNVGDAVAKSLGAPDAVALLLRVIQREAPGAPRAALIEESLAYLTRLGPACVAGVCKAYPGVPGEDLRAMLRRLLGAMARDDVAPLVALTAHPDERVAREAFELLADGGRGSPGWQALERAAQEAEGSARKTVAVDVYLERTGERERRALVEVVERSPERPKRITALRRLLEVGAASTFERLRPLALEGDLAARDDEEQDLVIDVLARSGGLRAVAVLEELAGRRSLFARKDTLRLCAAATRGLARLRGRAP